MYTILTTPNQILLQKAKPVTKFDNKLKTIIKGMTEALEATVDPIGVGLAAPQVGLSQRLFVMKPTQNSKVTAIINPVILKISSGVSVPEFINSNKIESKKPKKSKGKLLEGCLSLPNIWGNVTRAKEVTLAFQDENGNKNEETFSSFPAIIIQHEIDHLNGILFTKHVISQKEKLFKSHKNEKGEDEFDEMEI